MASQGMSTYLTMLTSDDFVVGALVLAYSLRKQKVKYQIAVMVTPGVSNKSVQDLCNGGLTVIRVDPIPLPNASSHVHSWIPVGLTKLRAWSLAERYKKIVYIDADAIAIRNPDKLFDISLSKTNPFAAAPDLFPPDKFNAGVLVLRPDLEVFGALLRRVGGNAISYDGGDTGFLNHCFPDWFHWPRENRLSFGFNAQRTLHWFTYKNNPNYWDIAVCPDLHILHFSSSPKPWTLGQDDRRREHPLERVWWQHHREMHEERKGRDRDSALLPLINLTTVDRVTSKWDVQIERKFITNSARGSPQLFSATFEDSMGTRPMRYGLWHKDDRKWLSILRQRYDSLREKDSKKNVTKAKIAKNHCKKLRGNSLKEEAEDLGKNAEKYTESDEQRAENRGELGEIAENKASIPRIIHQIWFGPKEPPAMLKRSQASLKKHHPSWKYILWRDKTIQDPRAKAILRHCQSLFSQDCLSPVEKSDIWRLAVLYQMGGVYVDVDVDCVGSLESLHSQSSAYVGLSNTGTIEINNAIIASKPSHPLFLHLLTEIQKLKPGNQRRSPMEIIGRTGPGFLTRSTIDWMNGVENEGLVVLPSGYFYPFPNHLARTLTSLQDRYTFLRPETLMIHHWGSTWQEEPLQKLKTNPTLTSTQTLQNDSSDRNLNLVLEALQIAKSNSVSKSSKAPEGSSNGCIKDEVVNKIAFFLGRDAR
ncbi:hypothetical protein AAMO2058_000955600 [Amorphochlora amoebiformis]|uniref:Alpha 1,4-glycosyltransferase domain-containing protein n=1 Tax=Amorphochlora amoebiformis TaxID=1561963 RepID=A0A7S0DTZ6_9EUKA|mmetsp:Transcript_8059/g.12549  ORF Transcript_8059/g.12549 Transcript_8059/m.12549 type:complete len:703 (+) Transcript_8059:26-2134(+)